MKHILATILLSNIFLSVAAQDSVPVLSPASKFTLDLSVKRQKEIERRDQLYAKAKLTKEEQKELDTLLEKNDETISSVWDIVGGECSWYCGGGNYDVRTSSSLAKSKAGSYAALSASDLSYQTAWVEGKEGNGIGEHLEYIFKNDAPRITSIIISNGYVKSGSAWKNNNRVKKLKLYVNGKPYRILKLEDTMDDQVFEIGTLGRNKNGKDMILRFEILEVYKGDKYNDTAITEIYFDGIDVH
jgi:hypothetical protein